METGKQGSMSVWRITCRCMIVCTVNLFILGAMSCSQHAERFNINLLWATALAPKKVIGGCSCPVSDPSGKIVVVTSETSPYSEGTRRYKDIIISIFDVATGKLIREWTYPAVISPPADYVKGQPFLAGEVFLHGSFTWSQAIPFGPDKIVLVVPYYSMLFRTYDVSSGEILGEFKIVPRVTSSEGAQAGAGTNTPEKRRYLCPSVVLKAWHPGVYCFVPVQLTGNEQQGWSCSFDLLEILPHEREKPARPVLTFEHQGGPGSVDVNWCDLEDRHLVWAYRTEGKPVLAQYDPVTKRLMPEKTFPFKLGEGRDPHDVLFDQRGPRFLEAAVPDGPKNAALRPVLQSVGLAPGAPQRLWRDPAKREALVQSVFSNSTGSLLGLDLECRCSGGGSSHLEIVLLDGVTYRELHRFHEPRSKSFGARFSKHGDKLFIVVRDIDQEQYLIKCYGLGK